MWWRVGCKQENNFWLKWFTGEWSLNQTPEMEVQNLKVREEN